MCWAVMSRPLYFHRFRIVASRFSSTAFATGPCRNVVPPFWPKWICSKTLSGTTRCSLLPTTIPVRKISFCCVSALPAPRARASKISGMSSTRPPSTAWLISAVVAAIICALV